MACVGNDNDAPRHEIHGDIDRRRVQRPAAENHIEGAAPQRTEASRLGDAAILQSCPARAAPPLA